SWCVDFRVRSAARWYDGCRHRGRRAWLVDQRRVDRLAKPAVPRFFENRELHSTGAMEWAMLPAPEFSSRDTRNEVRYHDSYPKSVGSLGYYGHVSVFTVDEGRDERSAAGSGFGGGRHESRHHRRQRSARSL